MILYDHEDLVEAYNNSPSLAEFGVKAAFMIQIDQDILKKLMAETEDRPYIPSPTAILTD